MKLVIFDIDGVILSESHPLELIFNCLKNLNKRGVHYTFATGRGYLRTLEVVKDILPEIPFIIDNGGQIVDKLGNSIITHPMKKKTVHRVGKILSSCDLIYANFCPLFQNKYYFFADKDKGIQEIEKIPEYLIAGIIKSIDEFIAKAMNLGCVKITVKTENVNKFLVPKRVNHCFSENCYCNLSERGSDKGRGVIDLSKILQIPLRDIILFGNDFNDIPMFKLNVSDKIAIYKDNCPDELKKISSQMIDVSKLPELLDSFA